MHIEKAFAYTDAVGYPILDLVIDGKAAYVLQPKLTLLRAGIVVLLDDDGHWRDAISARYHLKGEERTIRIRGGCADASLITIVRRFVSGETGDLLSR